MYRSLKFVVATALVLGGLVSNTPAQAAFDSPSFTWESPAAGAEVSGEVTFKATASSYGTSYIKQWCLKVDGVTSNATSDPANGVFYTGADSSSNDVSDRAEFDENTSCWNSSSSYDWYWGRYEYEALNQGAFKLDTTGWTNGSHSVQIIVTDSNSRSTASTLRTFRTSNANPSFTWESPVAGAEVSGEVTFKATASSYGTSYIKQWCLKVDGIASNATYGPAYSVSYSGADSSSNDLSDRAEFD
jgi:hypothetical protein